MTTVIVIIVIAVIVLAAAAFLAQKKKREAEISRAEELRSQAAGQAQTTIAPAQQEAAEKEARAEEARVQAERAEAEAHEAQVAAQQVEAEHEAQVRDADRIDPRVDHKADDYSPQVPGGVDQQPTPPSEVNRTDEAPAPATEPTTTEPTTTEPTTTEPTTTEPTATEQAASPGLPQRTRGAQEMPGKPIEQTDGGGGWFTRKDSGTDDGRA